jgi:hypothetical protein
MGRYTLLRVESRSGLLGRLLDVLPGVETVGTLDDVTADEDTKQTVLAKITATLGPPLREYGLLAAGGSMIAAGLSAVGLWWYRRRGDDTADVPDWADYGDVEHSETILDAESPSDDPQPEPSGRVDDRSDVEWATRDETSEQDEPTRTDSDTERASEPIDAAPLFGIAFLAITGAIVRWVKRGPTR